MNEIQLARMADRLQAIHQKDHIRVYVTTSTDIDQREADLINGELERRGCDIQVVRASSFEVAFKVAEGHGDALLGYTTDTPDTGRAND